MPSDNNMWWMLVVMTTVTLGVSSETICDSTPSICLHGGRCSAIDWMPGGYFCYCPQGYRGKRCEIGEICAVQQIIIIIINIDLFQSFYSKNIYDSSGIMPYEGRHLDSINRN